MTKSKWKVYGIWIGLTEAIGAATGFLIRDGVKVYQSSAIKPPLNPPASVFPVVWAILYACMGIGAARVWRRPPSKARTYGLVIYTAQLVFNILWSLLFFVLQVYDLAFMWLILLWIQIIAMIAVFHQVDRVAAWIQIPYLLWVTFAGYLNFMVWMLNGTKTGM